MQWDAARTLKTVTCEGIQANWESLEGEQSNDAIYTYDYGFLLMDGKTSSRPGADVLLNTGPALCMNRNFYGANYLLLSVKITRRGWYLVLTTYPTSMLP